MKIDRLLGIVVYLLNHGLVQSFYGVDGGYQLMEDYVFEKQASKPGAENI